MGPLGTSLQSLFSSPGIAEGDVLGVPSIPSMPGIPPMSQPQAPKAMSHGQIIAGIIADALAGAAGQPGAFGKMLDQQRQQQQEEVQWQRRRADNLQDFGTQKAIEQRYAKPDVAPALRDAQAWMAMTPDQQAAYRNYQAAKPQFIPDGLGGGQWAQPPAGIAGTGLPMAPVGKLTPLNDGGPKPSASGTFR